MPYNSESSYGKFIGAVVSQVGGMYGKIHVVCPAADPNYQYLSEIFKYDHEGVPRLYTTLEAAYAAVTSGANDVIALTGNGVHNVAAMLTVAKSRVTIVGMDGGGRMVTQGSRIEPTAAATDMAATITNTGTRNRFLNLKVTNLGTHANSVASMIDEGEGTYIKNCNFAKYSDLNVAAVADFICRADGFTYEDCEFGFDTLVQSAARATFWILNSGATRMKYGRVRKCRFVCASSDTTKSLILVANTSSLAFTNFFEDCSFIAALVSSASAAAITDAVTSVTGLLEGSLCFRNQASFSCTNFCATVTDQVLVSAPAASNNANEAVTPA